MLDPDAITQIIARDRTRRAMASLTAGKRRPAAHGRGTVQSNAAIAGRLFITDATVEKQVSAIFGKLGLPRSDYEHRRVRAVLTYLGA